MNIPPISLAAPSTAISGNYGAFNVAPPSYPSGPKIIQGNQYIVPALLIGGAILLATFKKKGR